jgi:hypothetical protein
MSQHADQRYGKSSCDEYIEYLGLWSYAAPKSQLHLRDPREYKQLLQLHLLVNEGRRDEVGAFERAACRRVLGGMK